MIKANQNAPAAEPKIGTDSKPVREPPNDGGASCKPLVSDFRPTLRRVLQENKNEKLSRSESCI